MIDILKGNCMMCVKEMFREDIMDKTPKYHFNLGYTRVHLCETHFCEMMKELTDFCKKEGINYEDCC